MAKLRKGITTGTCAAAAAKAAIELLQNGRSLSEVEITLPGGSNIVVPIKETTINNQIATATVIKDGGDDPDVTHGTDIIATVERNDKYALLGGVGVGQVTKPGLAIQPGQPAINPVPRRMIEAAVREVIPSGNVKITISVPKGEELARRTLNPKLGILGGISILGTTGIVEPMSEEAYKNSLIPQIDIAAAHNHDSIVFVPGKMGERSVLKYLDLPQEQVAQTSNFIGFMLEEAVQRGFKNILLWGHVAKLIKVAAGNMHTHNRVSDARFETLTAYAALAGRGDLAGNILNCNTAEEAISLLKQEGLEEVLFKTADRAALRAQEFLFNDAKVAVVFTDLKGDVLSHSANLRTFLEEVKWQKKSMWSV